MKATIIYHQSYFKDFLDKTISYAKERMQVQVMERACITPKCYDSDIIIVIGGDGTFLRASHFNLNVPMVGINPDPSRKEGFFMQSTDFSVIDRIVAKQYKVIHLTRLDVSINDNLIGEKVLNEVFIGDAKPYNMYNYVLQAGGKQEFQRSSGVLIGTPSGSYAWIKSAGGIKMPRESKRFQYIVREPYIGRLTPAYALKGGIIKNNLTITSRTPGIAVIDSISPEYKIKEGDRVSVNISENPLPYLVF